MRHYHVAAHSEDDDPYVTMNAVEAFSYAATLIDRAQESEHELASSAFDSEDWQTSATAYHNVETWDATRLNILNVVKQAALDPSDRAPIYRDEVQYGPLWQRYRDCVLESLSPATAPHDLIFFVCHRPTNDCVRGSWVLRSGGDFLTTRELTVADGDDPNTAIEALREAATDHAETSDAEHDQEAYAEHGYGFTPGSDLAAVQSMLSELNVLRLTTDSGYRMRLHGNDGPTYWWELTFVESEED